MKPAIVLDGQTIENGAVVTRMHRTHPRVQVADAADLREEVRKVEAVKDVDRIVERERERLWREIDEFLSRATPSEFKNAVPGNGYVVSTGTSAIALSAATAKTIMYTNAAAANQPSMVELCIGFDGVTASAVPVLIDLVFGTKATNSTPGTASTTFTALQLRGWPAQTSAQASANACSSEPTVLVAIKSWLLTPNGGLMVLQFPLGREPTAVASGTAISGNQIGIRCNAPAVVNVRGYYEYEE